MVCRAGVTFRYTENGPEGLLEPSKKAYIVYASGGTPAGADYDYATSYLKHIMGFIGIYDVTVIAADQLGQNAEEKRPLRETVFISLVSFRSALWFRQL